MAELPRAGSGSTPGRQRYMIGNAGSLSLTSIAERLRQDPQVDLVKVVGPPDHPSVLVVEMPADHAEQLKSRYADELVIEPDLPLNPLA